jgi:uncharacterized delta-60 repeat protein
MLAHRASALCCAILLALCSRAFAADPPVRGSYAVMPPPFALETSGEPRLAMLSDGTLVTGTTCNTGQQGGHYDMCLTFTKGGVVLRYGRAVSPAPAPGRSLWAYDSQVLVDSRDRIVQFGSIGCTSPCTPGPVIARYLPSGALDRAFARTGLLWVQPTDLINAWGTAGAVDASDRILVAGPAVFARGVWGLRVYRFLTDGSPDKTFGTGGQLTLRPEDLDGDSVTDVSALRVDVQGHILVLSVSERNAVVTRLTAAGALDASFGAAGRARIEQGRWAKDAVLAHDGKLLVGGFEYSANWEERDWDNVAFTDTKLVMLGADGSRDPGFGAFGLAVLHIPFRVAHVALQGDGKILLGGQLDPLFVHKREEMVSVARVLADGSAMDPSFGQGGLSAGFIISDREVTTSDGSLLLTADGRILVAGRVFPGDFVNPRCTPGSRGPCLGVKAFSKDGVPEPPMAQPRGAAFKPLQANETSKLSWAGPVSGAVPSSADAAPAVTAAATPGTKGSFATTVIPGMAKVQRARLAALPDGSIVTGSDCSNIYRYLLGFYSTEEMCFTISKDGVVRKRVVAPFTPAGNTDPDDVFSNRSVDVAVDGVGRIVMAGDVWCKYCWGGIALTRHFADGRLDASFGVGGHVVLETQPFVSMSPQALAVDASNRILVGTTIVHHGAVRVYRFLTDGSLDPAFGHNGLASLDMPMTIGETVLAVKVDAQGGILALLRQDLGPKLIRWTSDGLLDTSFGTDGVLSLGSFIVDDMTLDARGRAIVSGHQYNGNIRSSVELVAVLEDGSLDPAFGTEGRASLNIHFWTSQVGIQSDGKIVLAGTLDPNFGPRRELFSAVRILADGKALDAAFGQGGIASGFVMSSTENVSSGDDRGGLLIGRDGRIFVSGEVWPAFGDNRYPSCRQVAVFGQLDSPNCAGVKAFSKEGVPEPPALGR